MRFVADLHIHSYLSRATSKDLNLESLYRWAQLKGISLVGTGDFTLLYSERGIYAFRRTQGRQSAVVIFNATVDNVVLPSLAVGNDLEHRPLVAVWNTGDYAVGAGAISNVAIPARNVLILVTGQ